MHEPTLQSIAEYYAARGLTMTDNNARQAMILSEADVLPNDNGMAVGVALTHEGKHWLLLPGPPREMKLMFSGMQFHRSRRGADRAEALYSISLKFSGIGESALEQELIDLIDGQTDPTIAPYAKDGEVAVRLSTKAPSQEQGRSKAAADDRSDRRPRRSLSLCGAGYSPRTGRR